MRVLLISPYELGHQPFGLASPAAWLREHSHQVTCVDLAITPLPENVVRSADAIGLYLPMHTAARMAESIVRRVRRLNPNVAIAAYGLYAPLNDEYLRSLGVTAVIGGEFEPALVTWLDALEHEGDRARPTVLSLDRLLFVEPDRATLPPLQRYAKLYIDGEQRVVGYTEASRGCKHLCRHCPVVPVYNGAFRIVQIETVLDDIRAQVAAGAQHITFGDPDFLNGPVHARRVVEQLHAEFPDLTFDVTIKVEHLVLRPDLVPFLAESRCVLITSAIESVQNRVLKLLDKGHNRAGFEYVVRLCRDAKIALAPTFIPFTPWTTRADYIELLECIADLDLIESVHPVQLALRLLIPNQSRLLELDDVQRVIGPYNAAALLYPWQHPDPEVDCLAADVLGIVNAAQRNGQSRFETFAEIWEFVRKTPLPENYALMPRATVPYLDEPWFC